MKYLIDNIETLDDLMCGYKIIQHSKKFRFSMDAVLLAHFATIKKGDTIVDFCSGSGVVAFLIKAHNDIKKITCIEIQTYFTNMIQRSIEMNNVCDSISVVCDDLSNSHKIFGFEKIDLVTCNPPYFKKDAGKDCPDETLNISKREIKTNLNSIVESASKVLKNKGRFAMIHLAERADEIFSIMKQYNIPVKRARLIQTNAKGKLSLILVEGIKNAKSSIDWLPVLNIYKDNKYSDEVKKIYGQ